MSTNDTPISRAELLAELQDIANEYRLASPFEIAELQTVLNRLNLMGNSLNAMRLLPNQHGGSGRRTGDFTIEEALIMSDVSREDVFVNFFGRGFCDAAFAKSKKGVMTLRFSAESGTHAGMVTAMLELYCRVLLLQAPGRVTEDSVQPFNWPIEFGEAFIAPGFGYFFSQGSSATSARIDGMWLLSVYGDLQPLNKLDRKKAGKAFKAVEQTNKDKEEKKKRAETMPLSSDLYVEAVGCLELAREFPELKVLLRAAGYNWLADQEGKDTLPDNLVPVAPQWMQPFNFAANSDHVFFLVNKMEEALKSDGKSPIAIGEHVVRDEQTNKVLQFDVQLGDRLLRVDHKIGVWDVARQRMVGNVLEVPMNDGRNHFTVERRTEKLKFLAPKDPKKPRPDGIDRTAEAHNKTRVRKYKHRVCVPAAEMNLLNPYSLLIQGLFQFGFARLAKLMPEPEQMFDKELALWLHLTGSEEASGLVDGDRHNYERSVTYLRGYAEEANGHTRFPLRFEWKTKGSGEKKERFIQTTVVAATKAGKQTNHSFEVRHAPRIVRTAFSDFSLVPTNKATFVDSRFCAVQMKHVDESARVPVLRVILQQILKTDKQIENASDAEILAFVRDEKVFKDDLEGMTDEQVWNFLAEDVVFCLSSKVNKLVKRTLMADAFVGLMENSEYRGIHRYGQPMPSMNNVLTESLIFCGVPFAPGMALTLGENQFTLLDRHVGKVQPPVTPLLISSTKDKELLDAEQLPEYKLSDKLEKKIKLSSFNSGSKVGEIPYVEIVYKDGAEYPTVDYKDGRWFVEWETRPEVQKGEVVARVPFKNADTNLVEYWPIVAEADASDGANLVALRWEYTKQAGNDKSLVVEFELRKREQTIKCRNTVKAMVARYADDVVNLPANAHLNLVDENGKQAIRTIFFRDCNKWLDLVFGPIDIIAATIEKNKNHPSMEDAYTILRTLQLTIGEDQNSHLYPEKAFLSTGLAWHPAAALMGYYQKLIDIFESTFGKAVWVKFQEPFVPSDRKWAEGFIACSRKIYTGSNKEVDNRDPIGGWTEILPTDAYYAKLPIEAHWNDVLVIAQTKDLAVLDTPEGDKIDIVIYAKTVNKLGKEQHVMIQRGWGYVGTPDCPLYQPVKAELSSVRASITTSQVMGGVMRYFGRKDPAFARAMVWEGYGNYAKAGAIYAMSLGKSVKHQDKNGKAEELPIVDLVRGALDKEGKGCLVLTEDAAKILKTEELVKVAKDEPRKLISELAKRTSKVVFRLPQSEGEDNPITIYMPVVAFQDRNGMGNIGSFANLVGSLFQALIVGSHLDKQGEIIIRRLKASLRSLVKSKSLAKAPSRGRKGAVAKVVALPCIPLCEVWIKQSAAYKSEYQNLLRVNNWKQAPGKAQDAPCFFDRAPMPFGALIKVRVITPDADDMYSQFYDLMDDCTRYMNPIAAAYTGGDYDGDTGELVSGKYTVIDENGNEVEKVVEGIPYLSLEALISCVENRCGRDNLKPGASYYGDYLEILSQLKVWSKRGLGKKNMTLFSTDDIDKSLVLMLERSVEAFTSHVGKIHAFFLITDLLLSLTWECWNDPAFRAAFPDWQLSDWEQVDNLIEVLAEIYEVPLAGYDKPAYILFDEFLFPVLYEEAELSEEELIEMEFWMAEAGMNATEDKAWHLYQAALQFRQVMALMQKPIELAELTCPQQFVQVIAAISFLMSKGKLEPIGFSTIGSLDVDSLTEHLSDDDDEEADDEAEEFTDAKAISKHQQYMEQKAYLIKVMSCIFDSVADGIASGTKGSLSMLKVAVDLAKRYRLYDLDAMLAGGNELLGNPHAQMLNLYNKFIATNNLVDLINSSVILLPIEIYKKTMLPALVGVAPELDCEAFGFSLEGAGEIEEAKLPQGEVNKEMQQARTKKHNHAADVRRAIADWHPASQQACDTFNNLPFKYKEAFAKLPEAVRCLPEWSLFSKDQWLAELIIIGSDYKRVVLTGRAGSGKTMTSKFAAKALEMMGVEVWKAASTGIAAQNMGDNANTLASKFCLGIGELLPESCANDTGVHKRRQKVNQIVDKFIQKSGWKDRLNIELVIFVDEISMLSAETLTLWQEVVKLANKRFKRKYRFVFFGDFRQLLPVPSKSRFLTLFNNLAFDGSRFQPAGHPETSAQTFPSVLGLSYNHDEEAKRGFFTAEADTCVISLITNHRQKNAEGKWIDVLNALGDGNPMLRKFDRDLGAEFAKRVYEANCGQYVNIADPSLTLPDTFANSMPQALHIYHSNKLVAQHNNQALDLLIASGAKYKVYKTTIADYGNRKLQDVVDLLGESMLGTTMKAVEKVSEDDKEVAYVAEQTIVIGQKWMCRQNLRDELKNGTMGVVVELGERSFWLKTPYSKLPVEVSVETDLKVETNEFGEPIASAKGIPGHAAFALVPHKIQGLTFLPDEECPERGYVVIHISEKYSSLAEMKKKRERENGEEERGMHGVLYVDGSRTATPEQTFILVGHRDYLKNFITSNERVKAFVEFSETNTETFLTPQEDEEEMIATYKGAPAAPVTWSVSAAAYQWHPPAGENEGLFQHTLHMQASDASKPAGRLNMFTFVDPHEICEDTVLWEAEGAARVKVPFNSEDPMQAAAIAYLNSWQPPDDGGNQPAPDSTPPVAPASNDDDEDLIVDWNDLDEPDEEPAAVVTAPAAEPPAAAATEADETGRDILGMPAISETQTTAVADSTPVEVEVEVPASAPMQIDPADLPPDIETNTFDVAAVEVVEVVEVVEEQEQERQLQPALQLLLPPAAATEVEEIDIDDMPSYEEVDIFIYNGLRAFSDSVEFLKPNQVFVFGSNVEGKHGKGAAATAMRFGAVYGKPTGLQGQTYGILTKNLGVGQRSVPLSLIQAQLSELIDFASKNPQLEFLVTAIGCGLAGYTHQEIADCFNRSGHVCLPVNLVFDKALAERITLRIGSPAAAKEELTPETTPAMTVEKPAGFVVCGTGHRPQKLCPGKKAKAYSAETLDKLKAIAKEALLELKPTKVISGMALGWDTALALAAVELGIPFVAAVPFSGQDSTWPKSSRTRYNRLLRQACEIVVISEGEYTPAKMQIRNQWMIDRAHAVLALWDGSSGGTGNCVKYAQKQSAKIINVWDKWVNPLPDPNDPSPIYFNSNTAGYEEFSNFYVAPILDPVSGAIFPSAEALYQASKTEQVDRSLAIPVNNLSALSRQERLQLSKQIGKLARDKGKKAKLKANWDSSKLQLMVDIVAFKFAGHPELEAKLLATGDRPLIHLSPWDTYWGVDDKGNGSNFLGQILQRVRKFLRDNPA